MFPTLLAFDKSISRDAASLDVYLSEGGMLCKRNKDETICGPPLSAAVFYLTSMEDGQKLFQPEKEAVGLCPRCGKPVYEGKKNFACSDRACQFVMWKNDRFFEQRGKVFTSKIAAALFKDGKAKVKGLRSMRTGKTYDGTIVLVDTGGKYVNYQIKN